MFDVFEFLELVGNINKVGNDLERREKGYLDGLKYKNFYDFWIWRR